MSSRVLRTGNNQITQGFKASHKALDIVKYKSQLDDVVAHSSGTVVFCQTGKKNNKLAIGNASYGNCVKIDHGNGYFTLYAHLASVAVKCGQKVEKGQVLGRMGNTGRSYGAHLHFEVRRDNKHIDPTPYLEVDLPITGEPHITYRAYTSKWWPEVTDYNDETADGYAGVQGKAMTALQAVPSVGSLRYRVHLVGKSWLPWVTNDTDYAGVRGKAIDAVQMQLVGADGYEVKYRVSPQKNGRWYGWCTGLSDKTGDGYAGVFGNPIDCIQMTIVRKGS